MRSTTGSDYAQLHNGEGPKGLPWPDGTLVDYLNCATVHKKQLVRAQSLELLFLAP